MKTKDQLDSRLCEAARVAVQDVLQVKPGERVLIITNPEIEVAEISASLYHAVLEQQGRPVLICQEIKDQLSFCEEAVIGAIGTAPEVCISMSAEKMGKDRAAMANPFQHNGKAVNNTFDYLIKTKKMRSFWSPSATRDMFIRTIPVDYRRMKAESHWIKKILDPAEAVRITSPGGTDITFSLKNRTALCDDGDFSQPGAGGNLPAGETFVSPVVGSAEGVIVFDGSISAHQGVIVIQTPIRVVYEKGFITEITGGAEAEALRETITLAENNAYAFEKDGRLKPGLGASYARFARGLGELGIGTNPACRITGNMLEDEKVYETCHFAIGTNYDGDGDSLIHLDGLVLSPDITALGPGSPEGIPITRGGKLCLTEKP
ncbi:MAG: aminopeptidase [Spirochaetales bacterium]|jgi:leucyl aminopeptidase (aminopeptidase T)|nr:aminopeptidase [Spirochaetales bacterium]